MLKAFGASSLLIGALLLRERLLSSARERSAALWQLTQALSFLSREIGTARTPISRLLQRRGFGRWADGFFDAVYKAVFERGRPLAESWQKEADTLPLRAREKEELSALGTQFSAPAGELAEKLRACASALHEALSQTEKERRGNEKIVTSLTFCIGAFLVILLV